MIWTITSPKIPRNLSSLVMSLTRIEEIEKIIHELPNKSSHGHDTISNILLKRLNTSISYPLKLIFNQSITQGMFPESMKLAEVIPLHKVKCMDFVENYKPISLLITISKVLEKLSIPEFITILRNMKSCSTANMDSEVNILVNKH